MKALFAALALSVSATAFAQAVPDPTWTLSPVTGGKDKVVVGYIYHTAAIGTMDSPKVQKAVTGLRLVCSMKGGMPVIAIYWNGSNFNGPEYITTEIDGKMFGTAPEQWQQEYNLTYRNIEESSALMAAIRTGKNIKFSWMGKDAVRRTTMFSLSGYQTKLADFGTACKVSL